MKPVTSPWRKGKACCIVKSNLLFYIMIVLLHSFLLLLNPKAKGVLMSPHIPKDVSFLKYRNFVRPSYFYNALISSYKQQQVKVAKWPLANYVNFYKSSLSSFFSETMNEIFFCFFEIRRMGWILHLMEIWLKMSWFYCIKIIQIKNDNFTSKNSS